MSKLVPIRPSHEVITVSPPLTAAPRLAMDRIEASLLQRGMAVRRNAGGRKRIASNALRYSASAIVIMASITARKAGVMGREPSHIAARSCSVSPYERSSDAGR